MNQNMTVYETLAELFDYPGGDYGLKALAAQECLTAGGPQAAAVLSPFSTYMASAPLEVQQELFLRSFDVQAVTTLDLGYVLFGDDYKRGELLVNLNREHRDAGNDCGVELSDHLPNVLRLMPKLKDPELLEELAQRIIGPALRRMIRGFDPEQVELKDKFYQREYKTLIERPESHYTIFQKLLQALYCVLETDFALEEREPVEQTSDFLRNLNTETLLED
ncbi:MAG: hypothetical protein WA004_03300 [Saprospiraceae bacterium]